MSRLEKKCLYASTGAHALIALLLFGAPLIWVSQRHETVTLPVLTFIPSRLVDGAMSGGGSPTATTPAAAAPEKPAEPIQLAPPPAEKEQAAPPKPDPEPAPREAVKPPPKETPKKSGEPVASTKKTVPPKKSASPSKPVKHRVEISTVRDTTASSKPSAAEMRRAAEESARAVQAQYASKFKSVLGAISEGMSKGTSIESPGPGGEAFADYGQFVEMFYRKAWSQPDDVADELATVRVNVVILRDGTVDSFEITKRSGTAALDNSISRLENLNFIAPFPEGAKDARRTFIINFNLKADR